MNNVTVALIIFYHALILSCFFFFFSEAVSGVSQIHLSTAHLCNLKKINEDLPFGTINCDIIYFSKF